ncbi:MAG: PilZ domain-containing protein [Candidatus Omnitrophica bacterium]|nr:PilZ domain-containing protein [Candidatus Omnitrophota bacterium]
MMKTEKKLPWQTGIAILEDNVFEKQSLPDNSSIADRRRDPRFTVHVPLQYRVKVAEAEWKNSESKDVSNTGVRINVTEPTPIGTKMELDVQLPGTTRSIIIEGLVVWTKPSTGDTAVIECGVAFQNLRRVTGKEKLLQFISDKLCTFAIKHSPKDIECYPAESLEDLKAAYRLIYREYLFRGYCSPNASEMHYSFYCVLPKSRTFVLKRQGQLLGTISLIVDSFCGLPMQSIFHDRIHELRAGGKKLAEVSLLALNHEFFQKNSFSLTDFQKLTGTFSLFKILFDYARHIAGISDIVIAVHPKHEDLYTYLTFERLGSPIPYTSACGKPALPMLLNIEKSIASVSPSRSLLKFFTEQVTPEEILTKQFRWDHASLREILLETNRIWDHLPEPYRHFLKITYPGDWA